MKQTKLIVNNVLGIKHVELGGQSVEITGSNGQGKSSLLDAARLVLSNKFGREVIIRDGENQAEILIETDTGLRAERIFRNEKSDVFRLTENGKEIPSPQTFLNEIFTPLQLDPVRFTLMTPAEQNRTLLDLIEFPWDINWIQEQFGEIPPGVDYSQNILKVLNDIQAEKGVYYKNRQEINSRILHERKSIKDIAVSIPENYQVTHWEAYNLGETYKTLELVRVDNAQIERAKAFAEAYDNKIRGLQAERDICMAAEEKAIQGEREGLKSTIERLKAEIVAAEDKIRGLDSKLKDKKAVAEAVYAEKSAKLNADNQIAIEYASRELQDTATLRADAETAERMKSFINEYRRMEQMQVRVSEMQADSDEYTRKIELARELPGEILKTAYIPVEGMTVVDGEPLVHGRPISNLSDGEKLDLCVDVAVSKPGNLQMILIDGTERLSDENRARLYAKCKAKGLQVIATRTTNDNELIITEV